MRCNRCHGKMEYSDSFSLDIFYLCKECYDIELQRKLEIKKQREGQDETHI